MRTIKAHTLFFAVVLILAGAAVLASLRSRSPEADRLLAAAATSSATRVVPNTTAGTNAAPPTPAAVTATATPVPATATAVASTPPTTVPSEQVVARIKEIIQKANLAQQEAFTKGDPSLMQATATTDYYNQLVQINQELARAGVSAIKLLNIEWGPITLRDATTAEATTYETWRTTYVDGSSEESRDRNVYTLVQQQGDWKIQTDAHPDTDLDQTAPPPAIPAAPGVPGRVPPAITTPAGRSNVSHNWSGYVATGGTFTAVSGTWIVPRSQGGAPLNGRGVASGSTWVGIGGVRSRDLIQAGTEETVISSGRVRYDAWIELLPHPSHPISLTVNPGDSVTVSISEQGTDQWLISFKNNTTGQSYQTTVQYASSHSSAEWIEEAPSAGRTVLPLDNFGTVQFSGGTTVKDGKTLTIAQAGAHPVTMIDSRGNAIATPSALTSDGQGFSISRTTPAPAATPGTDQPFQPRWRRFPSRRPDPFFPLGRSLDPLR